MVGLRYVLPVTIVLGGAIVMAFGSEIDLEGGAGIVSAGLAVWGMNWLYRASIEGDRVRESEEAARDFLDAHGYWPDEAASVAAHSPRHVSAAADTPATIASQAATAGETTTAPSPSPSAAAEETGRAGEHAGLSGEDLAASPTHAHRARPHTSGPSGRRARG